MFGSTAATTDLIAWCRALRHGLDAGLSPVRVFRQQAKSGPSKLRSAADRVADRMETGDSLEDAFKPEARKFPPIFVEMLAVGEHTGRLPDVFRELEEYFESMRQARKTFVSMIAWPAFQWVAAICILSFMLLIIGMFGLPIDPLGLGLKGVGGAVVFFVFMMGLTAAVVGTGVYVANHRDLRAKAEAFALNIPGIGGCFRCFAVGRFAIAAYMTMEAGLRADRCLGFSLRATANTAYSRHAAGASKATRRGEEIASVLAGYGEHLFPADFLNAVQVGEDSGQLAEVMKKQAVYYQEEARNKFRWLARIAGGLVYAFVGLVLVVLIFKMAMMYFGQIDKYTNYANDPNSFMRGD
jgi:type IV pilus assembly protein PilC